MSINGQDISKNWTTMKGKAKPRTGQKDLLGMSLADTLDQRHDLNLLANALD